MAETTGSDGSWVWLNNGMFCAEVPVVLGVEVKTDDVVWGTADVDNVQLCDSGLGSCVAVDVCDVVGLDC